MANVLDVAYYFAVNADGEEEPEVLTHPRLQKLLYYAQGYSLALHDRPLFDEKIEAWTHGPVVPRLFKRFSGHGPGGTETSIIRRSDFFDDAAFDGPDISNLSAEETQLIDQTWQMLKRHSALSLREMTHREPPWINARKGYATADRCEVEITKDDIKRYFDTLVES